MEKPENLELDSIDLRLYLKIIQKWKWLIIGITLLSVITSGVLSFFVLAPVYESKTVIMVKQYQDPKAAQSQDKQDDLESAVNALSRLPQMTIKTYVGQIKNEALMRKVIEDLKLEKDGYTPGALAGIVDVKAMPETNLIELSVKNNDPELASKIANTVAEKFLEYVGTTNELQLVRSAEFLTKQLAEKNKELSEAAANLSNYRKQDRNPAYLEQEVQNKNSNLSQNQSQLLQVEVDYQESLAGKATSEQKLKNTAEKIIVKKIDSQTGQPVETEEINPAYTEFSQLVARKTVELSEREARKKTIQGSVEQLQNDLKILQAELNSKKEVDNQLQEKVTQIKQTRDILAEKLTQVQILKSVNLSNTSLQIVTPAFPQNSPVSPKKMQNMAIALVLGLMVSVALAIMLEMVNTTINKSEDIEQHLGLPILGMIPLAKKEEM